MEILKSGSTGSAVKTLQQQLIAFGFNLAPDGIFGPNTESALKQFQAQHNLVPDGIAGPQTYAVLYATENNGNTLKGIDISHHNGAINWPVLVNNVSFVFCKASQGSTYKDDKFSAYQAALKQYGIMRGAYHFFTFKSGSAITQAENFLSSDIDFSLPGVLPPVVDVEWQVGKNPADTTALNQYIKDNRAASIQLLKDWLNYVEDKTRRVPIIYTNKAFWKEFFLNPSGFEKYPLWIAAYQNQPPILPPGWTSYTFWQNSGSTTVNGVTGQVDTNIFNGSLDSLKKL